MKRIAINALSARGGGGITYLWNLFSHIPKNLKIQTFLFISINEKYDVIESLKDYNNIKVILIPYKNPIIRIIWENTYFLYILKKYKIDLLFSPGGTLPFLKFKNLKTITMFRNMIPFDQKELKKYPISLNLLRNKILSILLLNSLKKANMIIFISQFGKRYIDKITNNTIANSVVIPHGVSNRFQPRKKSNTENYILYPSSIDFYKNQKEVVKAFVKLSKKIKILPKLILAGNISQPYGADLCNYIKKNKIEGHVKMIGSVDFVEMPKLYNNANIIIFASRSENCPNILMEAMVSGKAIICSNKYPMPEFGKKGVLYFNANDPDDLCKKLLFVIKNDSFRKELEYKAKEYSSNYGARDSANKTWKILSKM